MSNYMEKDAQIAALRDQVHALTSQLETALSHQGAKTITNKSGKTRSSSNNNNNSNNEKSHHHHHDGKKRRFHPLSPHATLVREVSVKGSNKKAVLSLRQRMGRSASIATQNVLDLLHHNANRYDGGINSESYPQYMQRILQMFMSPSNHMDYLNSTLFGKDVYKLAGKVRSVLEKEPRVVYIQSPVYVFGDIHGNIEDLHFFSDNIWRLGMNVTAGNFLFLGDYVDRGLQCLECIAYLFTMKLQLPNKVFLLRGNHETRDVNGWEEHYGERSFIYQCRSRFGDDIGYRIWEVCNQAFDRLPLAAVIDQDIFCVHGGIPRPISHIYQDLGIPNPMEMKQQQLQQLTTPSSKGAGIDVGIADSPPTPLSREESGEGEDEDNINSATTTPNRHNRSSDGGIGSTTRIQDILSVPKVAGINPPYEHEDDVYQQVASDCIWSDPASDEQEMTTVDPETGFGESLRGGGAICFGHKAVTNFLQQQNFSYIMRAHEAHAEGVAVCKGARVFTVFSTSQDHNQGDAAMAGCILVDNDNLQVINRSPAYKNQYVHRRDSLSIAMLSDNEVQQRLQLGLIRDLEASSDEEEGGYDEEWEDFDSDEDEMGNNNNNNNNNAEHHHHHHQEYDHGGGGGGIEMQQGGDEHHHHHHHDDDEEIVDVEDDDDDDDDDNAEINPEDIVIGEEYVIDKSRRSSVDISSMAETLQQLADTDWESDAGGGCSSSSPSKLGGSSVSSSSSSVGVAMKRPRPSREPSMSCIKESSQKEDDDDDDDEEVETVDGEQDVIIGEEEVYDETMK